MSVLQQQSFCWSPLFTVSNGLRGHWMEIVLIYEGKGKIAFLAFFSPLPYYIDSTSKKGKFGTYYTTNEPNEIYTRFSGKEPKCLFLLPEGLK